MDKKIIFLLFLHLSIFPHPYDERLADIMIKAKEAYLKKNLTVLISASYDLLYLEEIKDLKKVLKLAE